MRIAKRYGQEPSTVIIGIEISGIKAEIRDSFCWVTASHSDAKVQIYIPKEHGQKLLNFLYLTSIEEHFSSDSNSETWSFHVSYEGGEFVCAIYSPLTRVRYDFRDGRTLVIQFNESLAVYMNRSEEDMLRQALYEAFEPLRIKVE